MNAPMPQRQPMPQRPPMGGAPITPTEFPGSEGGYPSGADVVGQEQQNQTMMDGEVENPVIAGFRSILMLIGELQKKGDPRGQQAAEHFKGLLETLSGSGAMQPPMGGAPPPGAGPAPGPEVLQPPAMGGAPAPAPMPAGPVPPPPDEPQIMSQFDNEAPPAVAPPKKLPMSKQQRPMGKQPVVLA